MINVTIIGRNSKNQLYKVKMDSTVRVVSKQWLIENKDNILLVNARIQSDSKITLRNKKAIPEIDISNSENDTSQLSVNKARQILLNAERKAKLLGIDVHFQTQLDPRDSNKLILTKAEMPDSMDWEVPAFISSISSNAFTDGPRTLTINALTTDLADYALSGSNIQNLIIKSQLDECPRSLCHKCSKLTTVKWKCPNIIGAGAFRDCVKLSDIDLSTVKLIGNNAFENCQSITELKFIGVDKIGMLAFSYCENLHMVYLQSVKSIEYASFMSSFDKGKLVIERAGGLGEGLAHGSDLREIHIHNTPLYNMNLFSSMDNLKLIDVSGCATFRAGMIVTASSNHFSSEFELDIQPKAFKQIFSLPELTVDRIEQVIPKKILNSVIFVALSKIEVIGDKTFSNKFTRKIVILQLENIHIINDTAFRESILCVSKLNSIGRIDDSAFVDSTLPEILTISNCANISLLAFANTKGCKVLHLKDINEIGLMAFSNMKDLVEVTLKNIGNISERAFTACRNLKLIKICKDDMNKLWVDNLSQYYKKYMPSLIIKFADID